MSGAITIRKLVLLVIVVLWLGLMHRLLYSHNLNNGVYIHLILLSSIII